MSPAYIKGKGFELRVAAMLRKKLGARVMRDRRSGAGVNKSDISDYYREIPLHMEIKDQETIKIKEWYRQADAASSFSMVPTVIFHADEEILSVLRFNDLLDLLLEIADQKAEIEDLRQPTVGAALDGKVIAVRAGVPLIKPASERVGSDIKRKLTECRSGHLADEHGYCMILSCKYSRGYRKPKAKRGVKK